MNRRQFMRAGTAGLCAASYRRVFGANERLGVAVIGAGRRGREVMQALMATGKADLRCLCDVYGAQREQAKELLVKGGEKPAECVAHEEALARKDVDAVVIATPDHLHHDIAVDALQAGKHVYLENPATFRFEEGESLLRAARISGKTCQVGTQQRSGKHYRRAKEEIFDKGRLGQALFVRAAWSNFPRQARRVPAAPKPEGLDWMRFLGRAPYAEYVTVRYEEWRYFPDYSGGLMAETLNHWSDVAQWMLSAIVPATGVASGGVYQCCEGRVNPDTINAIFQYRGAWNLTFESTVHAVRDDRPSVVFIGTEGQVDLARDGYTYRPNKGDAVVVRASGSLDAAHAADFIESAKSGKKPNADIEVALQGTLPCHLARASYWARKRMRYDADLGQILQD